MCIDISIGMCIGMCSCMCKGACAHMCTGMCIYMGTNMCMHTFLDSCIGTCVSLRYGGSPIGNSRVKMTDKAGCLEHGLVKEGEDPKQASLTTRHGLC